MCSCFFRFRGCEKYFLFGAAAAFCRERYEKLEHAASYVDPAGKVRYCLRKPSGLTASAPPTASCGPLPFMVTGDQRFPEAVPYFFSRIHSSGRGHGFSYLLPAPITLPPVVEMIDYEDDVRGPTLSSRHRKGRKGGETVCEDDVGGLTSSSRRVGAPDRTCSVLPGSFWRVFDADRTVDVPSGTLGGYKFVKMAAGCRKNVSEREETPRCRSVKIAVENFFSFSTKKDLGLPCFPLKE